MTTVTTATVFDTGDRRTTGAPLAFDQLALHLAAEAAGVDLDQPGLTIIVRLRDAKGHTQGSMRHAGDGVYIVTLRVQAKDSWNDRRLYPINNSLVHELRHVAQHQQGLPGGTHAGDPGYWNNTGEAEARFYGRLADHTGTKDTGPAGPAQGRDLWAIVAPAGCPTCGCTGTH